jgi:hypothetical protein
VKDDRKQPAAKERSNVADRGSSTDRRERERRSGEGAQSALANLRNIERDRQKSRPADDDSDTR